MKPDNEIVADYEQLETEAVQVAKMIGNYHNQLKVAGLSLPLIETLVVHFADQYWISILELNAHHVYTHFDGPPAYNEGEE